MCVKFSKSIIFLLSVFFAGQGFSQEEQVDVSVGFPVNNAEVRLEIAEAPYDWAMSNTPPKIIILSAGDIDIPIQISTGEFLLSDVNAGVFKFYDGKLSSITRNKINTITPTAAPTCPQPCTINTKYRPTLFVSIQGLDIDTESVDAWQNALDLKLMAMSNQLHYKHFAIDWQATRQILPQAIDAADAIKYFLSAQDYQWNVVLIGHSRGGIFAHELSKLLIGNSKIKKLHAVLLDPTAAPLVSDLYPTEKASGVLGYLKYDGQTFSGVQAGTVADQPILGYNNYGIGNNLAVYCNSCSAAESHSRYASDWLANASAFNEVKVQILNASDMGSFVYKEASGMDILVLKTSDINVALTSQCTDGDAASCAVNGSLTLGPATTVSIYNMISLSGVDASVATAVASATAVIRQDQITIEQTDLFQSQSISVTGSGLNVYNSILFGNGSIKSKVDKTGGSISINVGDYNIPVESIGPLDAIIPGSSHVKSSLKKIKKLGKKLGF